MRSAGRTNAGRRAVAIAAVFVLAVAASGVLVVIAASRMSARVRRLETRPAYAASTDLHVIGAPGPEASPPATRRPSSTASADVTTDQSRASATDFAQRTSAELIEVVRGSADAWLRTEAIEELVSRRSDDAPPMLAERLADSDPEVRRAAADGLAELGDVSALPAVRAAMVREQDAIVRAELTEVLEELRER